MGRTFQKMTGEELRLHNLASDLLGVRRKKPKTKPEIVTPTVTPTLRPDFGKLSLEERIDLVRRNQVDVEWMNRT